MVRCFQIWLPLVRQSAPASSSSSAISGVTPNPPAAFSQLTITKSAWCSRARDFPNCRQAARPGLPTMSPTARMRTSFLYRTRAGGGKFRAAEVRRSSDVPREAAFEGGSWRRGRGGRDARAPLRVRRLGAEAAAWVRLRRSSDGIRAFREAAFEAGGRRRGRGGRDARAPLWARWGSWAGVALQGPFALFGEGLLEGGDAAVEIFYAGLVRGAGGVYAQALQEAEAGEVVERKFE